ncbi:putative Flp pilus-assembly TadE/G-like protein [Microbacteriaceae bacterium MWH-Ta3]|nr:putative Flp pilus-assembly TadE/G-like protein [Microbacteriaceae bacterium MWH-Ta3]
MRMTRGRIPASVVCTDRSSERGSLLPLIAGLGALVLAFALAAIDIAALYSERSRVQAIADSCARVGAESFDAAALDLVGDDLQVNLTANAVTSSVRLFLKSLDNSRVTLVSARTPDGQTAQVTVRSRWQPPIAVPFLPPAIEVVATGSARLERG